MTNILLLCTDQQRFDALGAAGNSSIRTPNLDRLARNGTRFDACYVQSPVCAPSRASLMTGRYPHNHGLWANGVDISPDEQLFSKDLADADYDCGLVGKFHLGAAEYGRTEPRIDDGFRIFKWAHDPYVRNPQNHYHLWLEQQFPGLLDRTLDAGRDQIDRLPVEAHYTHWIAEETISFLRHDRDRDKPFFFVANFFDPHHGFGAPAEVRDLYDRDALPTPVSSDLATKPAIYSEAAQKSYAGKDPGFLEHTADQIREIVAQYYAMVTLVDSEVGRILSALEDEGLADDTLVIFTSDHGELLGDHQMLLKGPMMFDCSIRVPLIFAWPDRVAAGRIREELVEWIDLAPTILDAVGVDGLPRRQGRSLMPLISESDGHGEWQHRSWVLSEYRDSCWPYDPAVHTTMLRDDDWKLVAHHGDPATSRARDGELYDLATDPRERHNLWNDDAFAERRMTMQEKLLDVLVATEDRSQPRISDF